MPTPVMPTLPAAPFRQYIRERKARHARALRRRGLEEDSALEMAAPALNLSAHQLRVHLRSESPCVNYDTVDRVMLTDAREAYGEVLELVKPDPARKEQFLCRQCGNELRTKAELCGFCIVENDLDERMAA